MLDYLGNHVDVGDTVLIAVRSGRNAILGRAFVKKAELKIQFSGGEPSNMLEVEYSNVSRFWIPARNVVKLPDELLPEKRRERLNETQEGVEVT